MKISGDYLAFDEQVSRTARVLVLTIQGNLRMSQEARNIACTVIQSAVQSVKVEARRLAEREAREIERVLKARTGT